MNFSQKCLSDFKKYTPKGEFARAEKRKIAAVGKGVFFRKHPVVRQFFTLNKEKDKKKVFFSILFPHIPLAIFDK